MTWLPEPEFGKLREHRRVLIVGGSTRAAACSAVRAGWQPICADLFADQDTREIAEVIPVRSYPASLSDDVANVRAEGWFYTGALENRLDVIRRLQRSDAPYGPLWGTADGLELVRNPFLLSETLRRAGHSAPLVRPQSNPPLADGGWMRKPIRSGGGAGICVWDAGSELAEMNEAVYFQQRIGGQPLSAVFRRGRYGVEFLGATRQLVNCGLSEAPAEFMYCGSIGPLPANCSDSAWYEETVDQLFSQAELLAGTGLQGLFGIDFILDAHGIAWIVEVNPRYTASVEILELSQRRSLLCRPESTARAWRNLATPAKIVGKVILYATRPVTVPDLRALRESSYDWQVPVVADIPVTGSRIEAMWPICSVLAQGATDTECLERLGDRVDTVRKMVNDRAAESA